LHGADGGIRTHGVLSQPVYKTGPIDR